MIPEFRVEVGQIPINSLSVLEISDKCFIAFIDCEAKYAEAAYTVNWKANSGVQWMGIDIFAGDNTIGANGSNHSPSVILFKVPNRWRIVHNHVSRYCFEVVFYQFEEGCDPPLVWAKND